MLSVKCLRQLPQIAALLSVPFLSGCDAILFDPKGQIGVDERNLLVTAVVLMLLVVVPVMAMTVGFAWKYRASANERYEPNWSHSTTIEIVVWSIPCLIIAILAVLTWRSSHHLDPYKPLESDRRPITIEAVALDWKWLFIYPELKIATVNEVVFPANTPVNFKITSDTVMNSFFIPQLGSQIYAMAGMETQLHLVADQSGTFMGISANYSGHGFSKMRFSATATSGNDGFNAWVTRVKQSNQQLGENEYQALYNNRNDEDYFPVTYYSSVREQLFESLMEKYMMHGGHHGHSEEHMHHQAMAHSSMPAGFSGD